MAATEFRNLAHCPMSLRGEECPTLKVNGTPLGAVCLRDVPAPAEPTSEAACEAPFLDNTEVIALKLGATIGIDA